jgi:hypothetical protein
MEEAIEYHRLCHNTNRPLPENTGTIMRKELILVYVADRNFLAAIPSLKVVPAGPVFISQLVKRLFWMSRIIPMEWIVQKLPAAGAAHI